MENLKSFEINEIKNDRIKRKTDKEFEEIMTKKGLNKEKISEIAKNLKILMPSYAESNDVIMALARLTVELKDQIPEYDSILSDDASGRLPSLFLEKIFNYKRKKLGLPPIHISFIAGGRHNTPQRKDAEKVYPLINEFLVKNKDLLGKTLLSTEYIASGDSINELMAILEKENIDFDISSASLSNPINYYSPRLTRKLIFGEDHSFIGLNFTGGDSLSGVKKDSKNNPNPHPIKYKNPDMSKTFQKNLARDDIKMLAKELSVLTD